MNSSVPTLSVTKMNDGNDIDFFLTPSVSNMIFIGGAALCVFGLVLLTSAAIMMHRARNIMKKKTRLYLTSDAVGTGRSSHGETKLTDATVDNATGTSVQTTATETQLCEGNRNVETQSPLIMENSQHNQTGSKPEGYPDNDYTVVKKTIRCEHYDPPAPCAPHDVEPYACNPIPSPEVTQHYDQAFTQYTGHNVNDWHRDPDGDMILPPPPRSSPPHLSESGASEHAFMPQGSLNKMEEYANQPGSQDPYTGECLNTGVSRDPYTGEYSMRAGPVYQFDDEVPTITPREHRFKGNDSFSGAIPEGFNPKQHSYPVSKDGTILMTYM